MEIQGVHRWIGIDIANAEEAVLDQEIEVVFDAVDRVLDHDRPDHEDVDRVIVIVTEIVIAIEPETKNVNEKKNENMKGKDVKRVYQT